MVRWTRDGTALLHNAGTADRINIWQQPLDGSAPRAVTRFIDLAIPAFDISFDGKRLILTRAVLSRDAILLRNFR